MRNTVAAGALGAALLLAGCSTGAIVKTSVGKGSPICTDLGTFAGDAFNLTNAANETRSALLTLLPPIHSSLVKLQNEAPASDTVNTRSVKTDLGTIAGIYADLISALQSANPNDAGAVVNVLKTIQDKDGQALTDAVNRVDAYASKACGVGAITSTTTSTSTTVAPVGPQASTPTTAGSTSTT